MATSPTEPGSTAVSGTTKRRLIALAVAVSITAGAVPLLQGMTSSNAATAPKQVAGSPQFSLNFADLVENVQPSVVNISIVQRSVRGHGFFEGTPFENRLKRFFEPEGEPQRDHRLFRESKGLGSGFIISSDGYIVTNHHVVQDAREIIVTLNDGTRYPAQLRGSDSKTDLALLKIDAPEPLPHLSFGNSDRVRAGDWVVAIGNPFGLGGTVTAGIVSARGRDIQAGPFDDFLQVDAPINRGNSGGPLFDASGKVIGINTAIFSPNGGSVGIGFAIPASLAASVISELRSDGVVARGWLGVQIQTLTADLAASLSLSGEGGALIVKVVPGSPAQEAGLRIGDLILEGNGTSIDDAKDLTRLVANLEPGQPLELVTWRQGEKRTIDVAVAETPNEAVLASRDGTHDSDGDAKIGVSLAPLSADARARYGIDQQVKGALVVEVERGGPAARKRIRAGDVIIMVGQAPVSRPADVAKGVKRAAATEREAVLLLIDRNGDERFVAVPLT